MIHHNSITPWLEISLDAISQNVALLNTAVGVGHSLIAVVKDDAYGLGAPAVARHLAAQGVRFFAVATVQEALQLRNYTISEPILLLGEFHPDDIEICAQHGIRLSINDLSDITLLASQKIPCIAHCHIDTGMNRLGISFSESAHVASLCKSAKHVTLEGLYTHCASADVPDAIVTKEQISSFINAIAIFAQQGITPPIIHITNTAGTLRTLPHFSTAYRCGIGLYGCKPDPAQTWVPSFEHVVSLRAPVVKVRRVEAGSRISYGGTFQTPKATTIATICVGYAHGLSRRLTNNGEILIGGKRYPLVGRVTMDYIMVDIGDNTTIARGDIATIIGTDGNQTISVDDLAQRCQTIGYEVLCNLSALLTRYYLVQGCVVSTRNTVEPFHG